MRTLFYNWAKRTVAKHEKKKEEKALTHEQERKALYEKWKIHRDLVMGMARKFCDTLEAEYSAKNKPKFKVGQSVLLNPYAQSDGWEGSVRQMMNHTKFRGPTEVIIRSVGLDSAWLYEKIEEWRDRGRFDKISSESQYNSFRERVFQLLHNLRSSYQWVMHYYTFSRPEDPERKKNWRYPLREDKFVSPYSQEGKAAQKLWKLECQVEEKQEAAQKAKEEYEALQRKFHEKIGITYIG